MREGPHWTGYPPDDPPEADAWCSKCEVPAEDCQCPEERTPDGEDAEDWQRLSEAQGTE